MRHHRLLVLLPGLWGAACAAPIGKAEPLVGVQTLSLTDTDRGRDLSVRIWFVPDADAEGEAYAPLPPIRPLYLAVDAAPEPTTSPRPLVVLSHGYWGSADSLAWIAQQLVHSGYIVVAPTHPGTSRDDSTNEGAFRVWERSLDVHATLDTVLDHETWGPLIDAERIGFVGHSFGGWTGISLAGARYDPDVQRQFCQDNPIDFYCEGSNADFQGFDGQDGTGSFRDDRIGAFYVMASGPSQGFSAESLEALGVPVVADNATVDEVLDYAANQRHLAEQSPAIREIARDVGHFTYVPECRGWPLRALAKQICQDPAGISREEAHAEIIADIVAFFEEEL